MFTSWFIRWFQDWNIWNNRDCWCRIWELWGCWIWKFWGWNILDNGGTWCVWGRNIWHINQLWKDTPTILTIPRKNSWQLIFYSSNLPLKISVCEIWLALKKGNIHGDIWPFCGWMVALISLLIGRISKEDTPKSSWFKFVSRLFRNVNERYTPKYFWRKCSNTLKVRKRLWKYINREFKVWDSRRHSIY